ncbi:MAG: DUF6065 family protein [Bryobacteraceae bacterium]
MDENSCTITAYRLPEFSTFLSIVPAAADRFWMDITTEGWANRCLPLRIANQAGWHILNDCDFEVVWNGKPYVDGVRIQFLGGRSSPFVVSNFGYGIVTWNLPYLFRTPPSWNLLARGPANLPKEGVAPLEGLVETDWAHASFTMNWKITRPFYRVRFHKDEPICLIAPQRRGEIESARGEIRNIESDPEFERGYKDWAASRRAFVAGMAGKPVPAGEARPWQGHYTRGTHTGGEPAPTHQAKLSLRIFDEVEPPIPRPARAVTPQPHRGWWQRLLGR